jgi:hypothetical protein
MAPPIPTIEPDSVRLGDTWQWQKTLSDYPANQGWGLTYYFRKGDAQFSIACTIATDGMSFLAYVAPGTSGAYRPGRYQWQARVANGTDSYVILDGQLRVDPDPAAAGGQDPRSRARKIIEELEKASLRRAAGRIHVVIDGQAVQFDTQADLIRALSYWRGVLESEVNKYRISQGLGSLRTIRARVGAMWNGDPWWRQI